MGQGHRLRVPWLPEVAKITRHAGPVAFARCRRPVIGGIVPSGDASTAVSPSARTASVKGFHSFTEDHAEGIHVMEYFQDPLRASSGVQGDDGASETPGRHGQVEHQRAVGQKHREPAARLESSQAEGFGAEGGLPFRLRGIFPGSLPPEYPLGRIPGKPVRNLSPRGERTWTDPPFLSQTSL